ncbi:MAG: mannose-1-phosphate guanylyltransferase [Clostridium sp.]|uniref:mannose-1-phosphate guanylyltransferase n=3 Tax=Clostridium sp. TaxID=1506 RepID=UPI0030361955
MLYALILAGGKGTRLYPLSRSSNPKQFLKVFNEESFLRNTVNRIEPLINKENIFVVTNKEYIDKIQNELSQIKKENIFVEPSNKETATCIGLAAIKLLKMDKDATMVILPSDHYIEGEKAFLDTLKSAVDLAEKRRGLVTIGIEPSRPETGYGYIEMGDPVLNAMKTYKVARFTEKPNVDVAKDFILKGTYLWNSGMFVWRADVFLREMQKYLPKMHNSISEIYKHVGEEDEDEVVEREYKIIDGISVDFGIMQKTRKGYVIKSEFQWDDIGSFASLTRFLNDSKGNKVMGSAYLDSSENCAVFGQKNLIIGFGIKDLVIVDAGDVILVMDKNKDQEIKHLLNEMKKEKQFDEFL